MLLFYEQMFGTIFGGEVAFGFDYDAVRKYEVRRIVAVCRGVADSSGFVAGFDACGLELGLYAFFKAAAVRARFMPEDCRGFGVWY